MRKDSIEIHHILIAILFVVILGYGLFAARVLLGAFHIEVDSPKDGQTFTEPLIPISGSVKHAETIQMNGRTIPVNRDNTFTEQYLLSPGYNEVVIEASNKFGRSEAVTLRLFLEYNKETIIN